MKLTQDRRKTPVNLRNMNKNSIWMVNTEKNGLSKPKAEMNIKNTFSTRKQNNLRLREQKLSSSIGKSIKQYMSNANLLIPKYKHLFDNKSKVYIDSVTNSDRRIVLPKIHSVLKDRTNKEKNKEQMKQPYNVATDNKLGNFSVRVLKTNKIQYCTKENDHREYKNSVSKPKIKMPDGIRKIYNEISQYNSFPLDTKASLDIYANSSNVLIIGGLGANFTSNLTVYQTEQKETTIISDSLFSRTKYALIAFDNHILIHGGEAELSHNTRHMLNSFVYINAKTLDYHEVKLQGLELPYKKAHIGFIIGSELFLDGGLFLDDSVDDSTYAVNLITKNTRLVNYDSETEALCHHKCVSVNQNSQRPWFIDVITKNTICITPRSTYQDFRPADTVSYTDIRLHNSKEIIYVYGGLDSSRRSTSTVKVYQQQNGHLVVSYPDIIGSPPVSRYEHNMAHVKEINAIAIFGGRHRKENGSETFLNDLWLLQLNKHIWMQVDIELCVRYSFGMSVDDGDLLIFGGFGTENLIDGVIRRVELDKGVQREYIDYVLRCK